MNSITPIGHTRLFDDIRHWVSNMSDSQMINLIGPRGSGKSTIIDYVVEQIKRNDPYWTDGQQFHIARFSGASFPRGGSLTTFIREHLNEQLSLNLQEQDDPENDLSQIKIAIRQLLNDREGAPILVIIDEASRAIEFSDIRESQALIALRMPQVQFIIASDHRGLKLYDQASSERSKSFFSVSHAYFVNPLYEEEAKQLIQQIFSTSADKTDDKLHDKDIKVIYELTGGYPGLIQGVISHLLRESTSMARRTNLTELLQNDDLLRRTLSVLPREAQISELLEEMARNIERQDPGVQAMLLSIATNQFDAVAEQIWRREFDGHQREDELYMLGLLDINRRGQNPLPASLLAQFVLLRYLAPTLSKIEFALFELCAHSPYVVEYERMYDLLRIISPDFEQEPDKLKFVANVFSRIRAKCNAQPNGGAFEIENYQGRGYNLKWLTGFHEFYAQRELAFAVKESQGESKKSRGSRQQKSRG